MQVVTHGLASALWVSCLDPTQDAAVVGQSTLDRTIRVVEIGGQAKLVQAFAEKLKKQIDIEVILFDERLSTFGAAEKLAAADYTHKKTKKRLDAVAAAEILQAFLDEKHAG